MENILFIDVETVSQTQFFKELDEDWKELWLKKSKQINASTEDPEESYHGKAAIYAEFAKVICISVGTLARTNEAKECFVLKSVYGEDEKKVLQDFVRLLDEYQAKNGKVLFCGHNIKEFDIPFLCRRCIVHQIKIPTCMDFQNKKPWEIELYDTLAMWKFGDYKSYTSLNLLTKLLNIPSPKYDLDGSQVGDAFYIQKDMQRIVRYCEQDVIAVAKVFYAMNQMAIMDECEIISKTTKQ